MISALSTRERGPAHHGRTLDRGAVIWLLPVLVIAVVYFAPKHVVSAQTAVTVLLASLVLGAAVRWPDRSLILLIVLLPFEGLLLAQLWALGTPTSIVRHLTAIKETLALGVVVAGVRHFIATGRQADALDRLGLAFVAIAGLYLLAQQALLPSAPSSSSVRLLGFRQDSGFVLLMLGARHANLPRNFLIRAGRVTFWTAVIVAGIGLFGAIDSSGWNHFVVDTVKYTRYEAGVLHTTPHNYNDIRVYGVVGGTQIIRVGSVFLSALTLGFYLLIGFAVGLERAARGTAGPWVLIGLLMIVAALLLTQTRSAILGALLIALMAIRPGTGRGHRRAQLVLALVAIAVVALPTAVVTGFSERVVSTNNADNAAHVSNFWEGLNTVVGHPLGLGMGTSAGTGQRFQSVSSTLVIPENNYLETGIELGAAGMLLFVALTIRALAGLRTIAKRSPNYMGAAMSGALAGLALGAWFLQPWTGFAVAWTAWGLIGAALGIVRAKPGALSSARAAPSARRPVSYEQPSAV